MFGPTRIRASRASFRHGRYQSEALGNHNSSRLRPITTGTQSVLHKAAHFKRNLTDSAKSASPSVTKSPNLPLALGPLELKQVEIIEMRLEKVINYSLLCAET